MCTASRRSSTWWRRASRDERRRAHGAPAGGRPLNEPPARRIGGCAQGGRSPSPSRRIPAQTTVSGSHGRISLLVSVCFTGPAATHTSTDGMRSDAFASASTSARSAHRRLRTESDSAAWFATLASVGRASTMCPSRKAAPSSWAMRTARCATRRIVLPSSSAANTRLRVSSMSFPFIFAPTLRFGRARFRGAARGSPGFALPRGPRVRPLFPYSLTSSLYAPSSSGETHLMGVFRGERARCAGGKMQGV